MKKNRKRRTADVLWTFCTLVLTAWLFFDFSRISVLLVFYLPAALYQKEKESQRKKKWEMNLAFKDALVCMENSLAIGYSPESSIREAGKNLEQLHGWEHEICREFGRMVKQMELGNSVEEVFSEFGDRSGIEDIHQLADIFSVVKRTGGNLSMVLRQTGGVLQDKIELKRDLYTAIAAKRTEFQMMCVVPYGILLYLKLFAPAMCSGLYHNTFGILFMWGVWFSYLGLKWLGETLIRGELGKAEEKNERGTKHQKTVRAGRKTAGCDGTLSGKNKRRSPGFVVSGSGRKG